MSERKKEVERGLLLLSITTLALSPAWLGRGEVEAIVMEESRRIVKRRGGWERKRVALWRY